MDDARLKQRVQKIAESNKNVRFEELCNLLDNHIQPFCDARRLSYDHRNPPGSHHVFTVGLDTFTVVKPHGTPLLKKRYVESFLEAMEHIKLYE